MVLNILGSKPGVFKALEIKLAEINTVLVGRVGQDQAT